MEQNGNNQNSVSPVGGAIDDDIHIVDDSGTIIIEGLVTGNLSLIDTNPNPNPNASINLEMMYQLLQTSIKKIDSLQNHISRLDDHIIKMDVEIQNLNVKYSSSEQEKVEMIKLKPFELPAEVETDLDKLESNLKNVEGFAEKLVSVLFRPYAANLVLKIDLSVYVNAYGFYQFFLEI